MSPLDVYLNRLKDNTPTKNSEESQAFLSFIESQSGLMEDSDMFQSAVGNDSMPAPLWKYFVFDKDNMQS